MSCCRDASAQQLFLVDNDEDEGASLVLFTFAFVAELVRFLAWRACAPVVVLFTLVVVAELVRFLASRISPPMVISYTLACPDEIQPGLAESSWS
jgi:hypothetical protein